MTFPLVRLDECSRIVAGATPSTNQSEYWNGEFFWVTPADLSKLEGPTISATPRTITQAGLASCAAELLPPNSVLLSSRAPIGHVAINTVPMATNQGFKSFVPQPDKLDAGYLYHWLRANRNYLEGLGNGATFKEVSKAVVSRIQVPLPPLDAQQRIAAILDQADDLRRKRREALNKLSALPLSIFSRKFGDPTTNPKKLPSTFLGDVAKFGSGGTPPKSVGRYWSGSFPWVSPKDMKALRIHTAEDAISEEVFSATSLKKVPPGTPLIVVRGMILAHTVPIAMAVTELAINQDMKSIYFDKTIVPEFGLWCLKAQHQSILTKVASAAHGTKRLDTDVLKSLPILAPPISEQVSFVSLINNWSSVIETATHQKERLEGFFASLQHRAFRGEL